MSTFQLVNTIPLHSSKTVVKEYRHISTGTTLVYFDNGAKEKAFAAAFRTLPSDDSGVFHILEHSCVSGSKNFPVSSPILYMMKNSMQTYLNALTFPDKTVYPCASCNEKDFLNLTKVYLDAVFAPVLSRDTFLREGWHLEQNGENTTVSGVVFNEMRGAMTDPMQLVYQCVLKLLYPHTYQAYNSGGDPSNIPSLSYEKYLETFKTYYSTKNCVLLLSGEQDLENTFSLLDGYLQNASHREVELSYGECFPVVTSGEYEYTLAKKEDEPSNDYMAFAYHIGDYGDEESYYTANLLYDLLLKENDSPLKKALLADGLVGNVTAYLTDGDKRCLMIVCLQTKASDKEKIEKVIEDCLSTIAKDGFSKQALLSAVESADFGYREQLALLPDKTVGYFAQMANNYFFRLPLNTYFECDEQLKNIREIALNGKLISAMEKLFLSNPHRAVCVVKGVYRSPVDEGKQLFETCLRNFSKEQKQELLAQYSEFLAHAQQTDTAEAVQKMPSLRESDLAVKLPEHLFTADEKGFFHKAQTGNIVYRRDYFSLKGFSVEEWQTAKFLSDCILSLGTKELSPELLAQRRDLLFGRLSTRLFIAEREEKSIGYFMFTSAFCRENGIKAVELLKTIARERLFALEKVEGLVRQALAVQKSSFAQNGMKIALSRATAMLTETEFIKNKVFGYDYYEFLLEKQKDIPAFCRLLQETADKLFVENRRLIGLTADECMADIPFPNGEEVKETPTFQIEKERRAYAISSTVNYNVTAANVEKVCPFTGKHLVMANFLSRGYLWEEIRVKGNAYGTSLRFTREGLLIASSYRDPQVEKTYRTFETAGEYFKKVLEQITEKELFGCKLSVAGTLTKPQTVEERSIEAEMYYLRGISFDDRQRILDEACAFHREDVKAYVTALEELKESKAVCSVGNGEKLKESGRFQAILEI